MPRARKPRRPVSGLMPSGWIATKWMSRQRVMPDRMAVLDSVWEKEIGFLSRHWKLEGVQRGILFVKVRSGPAAQELKLRSAEIVKQINKHFSNPWITGIRQVV